ncbi:Fe-S oxidoreductase [Leucobacter albus]|uniref:Fe-S oxidoreductase n=1 Tax=Leucobacter albus TaxID=272210 RepID=A0ABW3TJX7_9MICO
MQLGSRWQTSQPPHPAVPEALHGAIAAAEREAFEGNAGSGAAAGGAAAGGAGSWTLTWLEGRPRVELIGAAGDVLADLRLSASGEVVAQPIPGARDTHDSSGTGSGRDGSVAVAGIGTDAADEDDDWLS